MHLLGRCKLGFMFASLLTEVFLICMIGHDVVATRFCCFYERRTVDLSRNGQRCLIVYAVKMLDVSVGFA